MYNPVLIQSNLLLWRLSMLWSSLNVVVFRYNICSTEKLTKRSTALLLPLVSFSAEQTLYENIWEYLYWTP